MQKFQTHSLSTCYSMKSPKDESFIVANDKQIFNSNDSGIGFGDSDNESITLDEYHIDEQPAITITNDVHLASLIPDDEKKFFCDNAAWAWHGEFGRLIMATALTYNVDYRLMVYDACLMCPRALCANYSIIRLDNAKAQFKCDTCGHCWTSMRARCAFYISQPDEDGIVLLKLYTQQCQYCCSTVYPLWYYDEICRVMKNLAFTVIENFFPHSLDLLAWDLTHNGIKPVQHLFQRKGNMHGQHNPLLCEACQLGFCY